jgi:CubicO group peptidase (beta-lactamase class C family)
VPDADRSDWDWNSAYWRNLASPWGGAHASARDLATFVEAFASTSDAMLPVATLREMRTVQTAALHPSYGFGWQREPGAFGGTCSAETFGHSGSTGTVAWHDPASGTTCVLLTTKPAASSRATLLVPVSEIIGRNRG